MVVIKRISEHGEWSTELECGVCGSALRVSLDDFQREPEMGFYFVTCPVCATRLLGSPPQRFLGEP